ncbi:dUTP diphosphatase [Salisediminibacterium selenitireducens]|uniref:dUTPase n=1 Tax=Bacillus selenitireducens (strain ATCC 700615 / DSM 15326 / MLS10) TaxID=439292 RepID=D6XSV2_BACIE|nr:dUTP diphosphatase [Salisediminibacterium selenitireducens]ADH98888.1 dUTPase [[Bacillus] selenitireducens MLS10]
MDINRLFKMQKALDESIEKARDLQNEDLLARKCLAFCVELGELANETRCFKFWSDKGASDRETILEEYVDGVHFLLSIGLELNLDSDKQEVNMKNAEDIGRTAAFIQVYQAVTDLQRSYNAQDYQTLFDAYWQLGASLGFKDRDVERAYDEKNEVNYQRQKDGY